MSSWPHTVFNDNQKPAATNHSTGMKGSYRIDDPFVKTLLGSQFVFFNSPSPPKSVSTKWA